MSKSIFEEEMDLTPSPVMRSFGVATRNLDDDKLDYIKGLSPIVLKRYMEYLRVHRDTPAGKRDYDNWRQGTGIPKDVYLSSLFRHVMNLWLAHEGITVDESIEDSLAAIMFNSMGYMHQVLKDG